MQGKLIVFSAPSGAGKSTLVQYLIKNKNLQLEFSVSATCRLPRGEEQHGKEYYFLSSQEFQRKIENNEFIEFEEVYQGCFYGTLRSEIERITAKGKNVIFDIDVVGGLNIKQQFGNRALTIFVAPPSVAELRNRLTTRGTDSAEKIVERVAKAEHEMGFAPQFDIIIVNDNLQMAKLEVEKVIEKFLRE